MAISPLSAAQYVCAKSGWTVTQLSLQKILYLAHMVHLGRGCGELVSGHFEAWDYGPVHPALYHKVKGFGAKPIRNVFWSTENIPQETRAVLDEACEKLLNKSPSDLVENTHWSGGAWAEHYVDGARSVRIPSESILNEYRQRMGRSEAA